MQTPFDRYISFVNEFNRIKLNPDHTYYVAKLGEEFGELTEACIALMYNSKSKQAKILAAGQTPRERFVEEAGDVFNILVTLASINNVEPDEIFDVAAAKIERRIAKAKGI